MGAPVAEGSVVSAARATALLMAERRPRRTMVLGGQGLVQELRDVGLTVVAPTVRGVASGPDALVVGVDFSLTYARLTAAANVARSGAWFVATNRDPIFPLPDGFHAGAGSIVEAVAYSASRRPDVTVGKPEPGLFLEACALAGEAPERAIVIGDSLTTDMVAARAIGARRILMLTGVTSRAKVDAVPAADRPDHVAADAAELAAILDRLAAG
jgi:hypothetical protein